MFLEDPDTAVVVDVHCESVHDVVETFVEVGVSDGFAQRVFEDLEIRGERVLIHRVDGGHLGEDEEQNGASFSRRSVAVSEPFDVSRRLSA